MVSKNNLTINDDVRFKELVFAILERISTLYCQVQPLDYSASSNKFASLKSKHFIQCLKEVFSALVFLIASHDAYLKDDSESNKRYAELLTLFKSLIQLSAELSILPKQDVPIEIYRFLRIFNRDGIADNGDTISCVQEESIKPVKFVLYSDVDRSAATYENHPLDKYVSATLKPALCEIYREGHLDLSQEADVAYHICIPRDETQSPLCWPVLGHEVGHQVMALTLFQKHRIEEAFSKYTGRGEDYLGAFSRQVSRLGEQAEKRTILRDWLTECWCDIYAYFATGPAILYAQRNAFILHGKWHKDLGSESHPPCFLRLLVIQMIFDNHQKNLIFDPKYGITPLDSSLSSLLQHEDNQVIDDIADIAQWFSSFFNDYFKMDDEESGELHAHIVKLKSVSPVFDNNTLSYLVDRLNAGYPIPSIRCGKNTLDEKETSIHEIMLSAWISHDTELTRDVIETLCDNFETLRSNNEHPDSQWHIFEKKIAPIFERFNQAVLRSLQISEWVSLLKPDKSYDMEKETVNSESTVNIESVELQPVVLVDKEIKALLWSDELKVIPLIDLKAQLGSTTLDVRLGPTFQTYQPNQSGVVDFTNSESVNNVLANSSIVDLDFAEGIVLAPGQFVLAHTMEYFGFPKTIAAQIEGRSSFARLGVQVHMTANLIDPGFHGSITFEIFNAGPNPIRLFPGYRIGQLRFFNCKVPDTSYDKKSNAKYKGQLVYSKSLVTNDYEVNRLRSKLSYRNDKSL